MCKNGLLIIFSGPSGVGKNTVRELLMKDRSLELVYSISMTTRKKRQGEKEGFDYFFVSEKIFHQKIKENALIEYTKFVSNYYGTPREYVKKRLLEGKNVLLEIEVDGANQVMNNEPEAISIFLMPPSFQELERRIRERSTEPEIIIQKRLLKAKKEMNLTDQYDYTVVNEDRIKAASEISEIIMNEMELDRNKKV